MKKAGVWIAAAAIGITATGCASGPWPKSRDQIEVAPAACEDFTVSIYFERDSAEITREARQVLRGASEMSKGCTAKNVHVVGLADAVGAPDANLALSQRRAGAVSAALAKVGFRNVSFEVTAAGDAGAVTRSGEARPLRRRADVRIDLEKPARP
jgi:peptidoglycan-associated lipoprotein